MREIDEFELLDIEEQAREVGKLTPLEYARLRGKVPQLIYYYIRNQKLSLEYCVCGRRVLDVKTADDFFASLATNDHKRRTGVDRRSDEEITSEP